MSTQVDPAVAAAAANGAGAATTDWKASLPEDMRALPVFEKFKGVGDLAKSYTEIEKLTGSATKIPKSDAPQEDWDKFWAKTGRPESADKYEFTKPTLPDGVQPDAELETAAKAWAHKAGLHPRQAQALYEEFSKFQMGRITAHNAAQEKGITDLKKEWGNDYEKKVIVAQNAISTVEKQFGVEPGTFKNELDATGLGNSPILIKHFAALGAKQTEGGIVVGDVTHSDTSVEQAKSELATHYSDKNGPYLNDNAPSEARKIAIARVGKLHRIIMGVEGR